MRLSEDTAVIFHRNGPPIFGRLLRYFDAPEFRRGGIGSSRWLGARALPAALVLCLAGVVAIVAAAVVPLPRPVQHLMPRPGASGRPVGSGPYGAMRRVPHRGGPYGRDVPSPLAAGIGGRETPEVTDAERWLAWLRQAWSKLPAIEFPAWPGPLEAGGPSSHPTRKERAPWRPRRMNAERTRHPG